MSHVTSTGIDNRKICMWVVIGSECMLFGTLIVNYIIQTTRIQRMDEIDLIQPTQIFNILLTSTSTFILLMSSLAMVLCLSGLVENNIPKFRKWCFITALFGTIFLGFQVFEFTEFYLNGLGLTTNLFGSAFFILTGTHGAHVFVGVLILSTILIFSYKKKLTSKHSVVLETIGLYWHFVDVIWIIIFTVVYLFVYAP